MVTCAAPREEDGKKGEGEEEEAMPGASEPRPPSRFTEVRIPARVTGDGAREDGKAEGGTELGSREARREEETQREEGVDK